MWHSDTFHAKFMVAESIARDRKKPDSMSKIQQSIDSSLILINCKGPENVCDFHI